MCVIIIIIKPEAPRSLLSLTENILTMDVNTSVHALMLPGDITHVKTSEAFHNLFVFFFPLSLSTRFLQELSTLLQHMSSPPVFSRVCVTRSLVFA
jgi:hypothetical protein